MRRRSGVGVRRAALVLSAVLLMPMAWAVGVLPAAGAGTPTQLQSLSFSWSGGQLRGIQVKYVDITLRLVDPDGITAAGCPCVFLTNTSNPEIVAKGFGARGVNLRRIAGDEFDGVWQGRFAVGANDAGIWKATSLLAGDFVTPDAGFGPGAAPVPEPWNSVTLNVRGYDAPQAWLGTPVRSAGGYVIRGGVSLSGSQTPVVGIRVELLPLWEWSINEGTWTDCSFRIAARTDAIGHFAYWVPSLIATYGEGHAVWRIYPTDTCTSILIQSNARNYI